MEPLSWLLLRNNWIKSIYKTLPNIYHKYFFAKVLSGWKPLAIFTKISTKDVWQGPKYTRVYGFSLWYKSSHLKCSIKKRSYKFRKFFKNTCARVSFLIEGLRLAILLKKRLCGQAFFCEFCEVFKNIFFYSTPLDDCFWCENLVHKSSK